MKYKDGELTELENTQEVTICFQSETAPYAMVEEITLPRTLLESVIKEINVELYYKEDVLNEISDKIEDGDLPKEAYDNKEYTQAVLEKYTKNREDDEGLSSDDILGWDICLSNAFDEVSYDWYCEDCDKDE